MVNGFQSCGGLTVSPDHISGHNLLHADAPAARIAIHDQLRRISMSRSNRLLLAATVAFLTQTTHGAKAFADEVRTAARFTKYHGYTNAVELSRGNAKAILCPQAGGRVLEFTVDGKNAMFLDEQEQNWQPGRTVPITAGRFDYGPELTTTPHPKLWSGEWTAEITGDSSARLTSPRDETAGVQLVRDFVLDRAAAGDSKPVRLSCKQTIRNISQQVREVCHWGRSFSPGGGIALVPLGDRPSRFPSKYAMYEDSAIINVRNTDERIRERDGFLEILSPPRKPKLGFDSHAGWLAYLMPNDALFVKKFATYPDRVYNEAAGLTLSVWYPEGPRIELEPIGPRERLQPGETASFTEEWWLQPFPFPKDGQRIDLKKLSQLVAWQTQDGKTKD
jgi:hypothetical protein